MKRAHVAVVVTCLLLGVTIYLADPMRLVEVAGATDPLMLAAGALLTPIVLLLRTARWYLLGRTEVTDLSFAEAWQTYLGGLTLAVVTPLSAGELGRGALLRRGDAIRLAGVTLADKLVDLSWVVATGAIGLSLTLSPDELSVPVRWFLWSLPVVVLLGWVATRWAAAAISGRLPPRIGAVVGVACGIDSRSLLAVVGLSGLGLAVYLLQGWFVLVAVAPESPLSAMGLWPAITLSTILPAFAGGVGPREASAAVLLPLAGVEPAAAASAAFLQFGIVMVLPALFGWYSLGPALRRWARRQAEPDSER